MRITFAIALILSVWATKKIGAQSVLQQQLSIDLQEVNVSDALLTLSEISDVNITFSPNFFRPDQRLSIVAQNESLETVLRRLLARTNIGFRLSKSGIVLYREAPRRYSISGYLSDARTGERLVGANIIELNSRQGGTSNAYGFYNQQYPSGKVHLQVSYLGYQSRSVEIDLQKDRQINLSLEPSLTLQEIIVLGTQDSMLSSHSGSETTLPLEWLAHLPAAGGETDIFRSLQLLPGIHTGGDGFGGLHVRGGNSDQNLILFDDVPIYNPSHTFGLFSIFNPDIVKNVKFYKGGFSARYDGRLSSVLDVRTKEGNDQHFSAAASVGTMLSRAVVELPLADGKGGLLLAGRKTHINMWLRPLSARQVRESGLDGEMNYLFTDLNAKAHYSINLKNKLYLSFYSGADQFINHSRTDEVEAILDGVPSEEFPEDDFEGDSLTFLYFTNNENEIDWGNKILSLRWNHLYNDKLFSNTTATLSHFKYESANSTDAQVTVFNEDFKAFRYAAVYSSLITDYSLRTDFDWYIDHRHHLRFGANTIHRSFVPGLSEIRSSGNDLDSIPEIDQNNFGENEAIRTLESSVYLEDEFTHTRLSLLAGIRLSSFWHDQQFDLFVQPRLSAHYRLSPHLNLNASVARTTQFLHLLTRADAGLPNDLWVPASEDAPPQMAWQMAGGFSGKMEFGLHWSIEGYWKRMEQLFRIQRAQFDEPVNGLNDLQIDATNWENYVEEGDGTSYGIECTLEYQKNRFAHWLGYTYAKTTRHYAGREAFYNYDSRHSLTLATTYRISDKLDISASWMYQSGRPVSLNNFGEGDIPFLSLLTSEKTDFQSSRFSAYHRLDVGMNLHFGAGRLQHKLQVGIYNAYNHKNVFFAYQPAGLLTPQVVYGLPILPSVSYSVEW